MTAAETSLQAYMTKKKDGSLEGDQKRVYEIIESEGPISSEAVARRMQKYPHQISGRFTELLDKDIIEISGFTTNSNDNQVRQYEVK